MQEFYCYNHKNISCMIKLLMKMDGNNNIKTKLNEISKWKFWNINGQNEITQNFKGQKCTLIFWKETYQTIWDFVYIVVKFIVFTSVVIFEHLYKIEFVACEPSSYWVFFFFLVVGLEHIKSI